MSTGGLLRWAPRLTLALLVVPVAAGLLGTVIPAFSQDAKGLRALLDWPGLPRAAILSLTTGVAATALSLAVTLLLVASLWGTRAFALIQHMLAPLLSVPHAAAALGLAFLIAPSGWIVRLVSPWATGWALPPDLLILNDPYGLSLTLGLVTKEVPFLFLMALAALPQTDVTRRINVAQSLGAGRVAAFVISVFPSLYRQLRLPVYAVLAYSMTAVEMAMILGPTRPYTLSVQVVIWMADPMLTGRATASAGAILQLALVGLALGLWVGSERLARRLLVYLAEAGLRAHGLDPVARWVAVVAGALTSGALILGLAGLAVWSVAGLWQFPDVLPESLTLRTWLRAAPDLVSTGGVTLGIAALATALSLALVLACLEAEHRFALLPGSGALWVLYLPLLVPQVAFLPGLQIAALRSGAEGHWVAVSAAHMVFVLPYVFLSLAPAYRAWDSRIAVAGMALGATPSRVFWRLRLPMVLRPVLTAAAVGGAVSVGQYLPTLLIGGGRIETLTTEAVALSSGGNRRLIGAYALLQMILPAVGFALALLVPALLFRNRRGMSVAS
ncbi:MAG: ABC transporter permease subunit [Pseudotabrizicola sp.]|uniref:ABC transporter permease n=1 Tax=Pseudotabrizicola sp. TaxID=2939647 RepID=UPI00272F6115|nr:ABC transporter permease subunit [Pseudotabrizicola sp.]MDP2083007.1 ABC transporter permease subunit [Pseudotabrizicola sp.]MDZ7572425.1 ABC transporter permease subunit [Pseudotabrizicola sp.]